MLTEPRSAKTERAVGPSLGSSLVPVVTCLLAALVFTLDGYNFGRGNQISHLPAIMRLCDPSFLERDYFVNALVEAGPRYYYFRLLALGSQLLPLPLLAFLLTLGTNAATLLVTFRLTERAFDVIAAHASIVLLCALHFYVRLGGAGFLLSDYLTPASLAIPCALAAIAAAIGGHRLRATLWAIATSVVHPLYGLAAGGALALTAGLVKPLDGRSSARERMLANAASLAAFAAAFMLLWHRAEAEPRLDDGTFFEIYGRVRAAHHLLPSRFPGRDWAMFGIFTASSACFALASRERMRSALLPLAWLGALALLGFIAGYVFVEVVPVRLVLVLQLYRFTCFTTWLGIVLAAGAFSALAHVRNAGELLAWRPLTAVLGFALLAAGELLLQPQRRGVTLLVISIVVSAAWAARASRRPQLGVLGLATVLLFLGLRLGAYGERRIWLGNLRPSFVLSDVKTRYDDVARFAREHTAVSDVFVIADGATSANAGMFRYKAGRALFGEYKVFPFRDGEMAEWYERDRALKTLRRASNNDLRLWSLSQRYDLAYAVLSNDMPSAFPVAFQGDHYRLVSLRDSASLPDERSFGFGNEENGAAYLGSGWHATEAWGVWSKQRRADLVVPLRPERHAETLALKIGAFTAANHPRQEVECWVNGVFAGRLELEARAPRWRRVTLPAAARDHARASGALHVRFEIGEPGNPARLGVSGDTRDLGIALYALELGQ
jgi:hypothetical protein